MKKFLTIIFFKALILNAYSVESRDVNVWIRKSNGDLHQEKVVLENLLDKNSAETENFKVVLGREETAVKLDDSELGKKAANVLYHLEFAHAYFKEHLKSPSLSKTTVRLEIADTFLAEFHWGHKKFANNFNNALTIPPSDHLKYPGVTPWGNEIWFRPKRELTGKSDLEKVGMLLDDPHHRRQARGQHIETSAATLAGQALNGNMDYAEYELGYLLGMLTFVEVFPKVLKIAGKTHKKKFELDTAMIPEVIYHEYSHIALYDYLSFDEKTPVVEGVANYFAAKMIGYHKLGYKLKHFGKGYGGYNGKQKRKYDYSNEVKGQSHSSFLLSLFWSMDQELDDFEFLIFETRKHLTKDSDIKYDLVDSLSKTLDQKHPGNRALQIKLLRILNNHGV